MPSDLLPDFSSEQEFAHKLAAQKLVKYCEEFSRWRESKGGSASLDKSLPAQGRLGPPPMKRPDARASSSSA